jgi:hypothetical protein
MPKQLKLCPTNQKGVKRMKPTVVLWNLTLGQWIEDADILWKSCNEGNWLPDASVWKFIVGICPASCVFLFRILFVSSFSCVTFRTCEEGGHCLLHASCVYGMVLPVSLTTVNNVIQF